MQPTIIQLQEFKVVGLGTKFISILSPEANNFKVIPPLWDQFIRRIGEIKNRKGKTFGVVEQLPANDRAHEHEMFYIACAEVVDFSDLPDGMVQRTIPAGKYASFTHKGKLDKLGQTMSFIHRTWMSRSAAALRNAPEVEVYDERFNPGSDQSELDILIPIA